jgi:hypothetical protein
MPTGIHHHLLLVVDVSGTAGVVMVGLLTDVVPSAVGVLVPNPGIVAARAAGMVIRPPA